MQAGKEEIFPQLQQEMGEREQIWEGLPRLSQVCHNAAHKLHHSHSSAKSTSTVFSPSSHTPKLFSERRRA
ncbi:hypothetical protein KSD_69360 [Ktedonobacter sp. SOSP1-85]|nr:hypothetical protein KSD_69360 [Ktedonobacter sp. SOSP1-85]